MSDQDYTATHGLMQLLRYQNNYPALGTGANILVSQANHLLGGVPKAMNDYTQQYQINLFGDYPISSDKAPSAIFAAVFGLLMILHILLFSINWSRGHHFWLSMGWAFYCMLRMIGFIMRIIWSTDLTQIKLGIANEVFMIVPSVFLVSFNLILAQRIFTWRHPVGGSRMLFWNTMFTLYGVVSGLVAMTIVSAGCPYLYFLSETNYLRYKKVTEASSICIILYSLTAMSLLGLAYFFKPTAKDENLYTYQPWWIESFSPFYFVRKNAARDAEETFMKRNHNHRHAIRVIAATQHHHNMVEGLSNDRGDLKHNTSLIIITITTVFIFIGAILRAITVFQRRYQKDQGPVCKPVVMYIFWGLLEVIINVLYIVGRVDLRFYRPDILPKKVRAIITAEQSINVSDAERSESEEVSYFSQDNEFGFNQTQHEKNVESDNESEFHF